MCASTTSNIPENWENPLGTDGFEFLEFATPEADKLGSEFTKMGFELAAKHKEGDIRIYQQNDIRFIINSSPNSKAREFSDIHGPSVSAMGFRVKDAKLALEKAIKAGAKAYQPRAGLQELNLPAIHGVGNSLIYFVERKNNTTNYDKQFTVVKEVKPRTNGGLMYLDHVTHNLFRGEMNKWAEFYEKIFNFREIRYFDIAGKLTGLKSRAMTGPCRKLRIPLNESSDDKSQIEEFLHEYKGEGIQHIALGTDNIYNCVAQLSQNGLEFLDTPDTYYEKVDTRLPGHGENLPALQEERILIDGTTKNERKLLLQIFTKNMIGPVFFEIIQRKGDEGFGEGNFKALFESIEEDQIRRGVLKSTA